MVGSRPLPSLMTLELADGRVCSVSLSSYLRASTERLLTGMAIISRLYGFTVLQALYYYEQFPKDSRILKLSVRALSFL